MFSFKSPALKTSVPVATASVAFRTSAAEARDFASFVSSAISTPEKVRAIFRYRAFDCLAVDRTRVLNLWESCCVIKYNIHASFEERHCNLTFLDFARHIVKVGDSGL